MGLSRNKVAVPEGAAGTPPFWSERFRKKKNEGSSRGMNEEYLVLQVGYEKIIERKDEAGKPAKLTVL